MCSRVPCTNCKKFTWSGCGQHVEEALYGLKDDQICVCDDNTQQAGGFFSKLFGKR